MNTVFKYASSKLAAIMLIGSVLCPAIVQPAFADTYNYTSEHVLGTSLETTIEVDTAGQAALIQKAVRDEISRLEAILSTWDANSEISKLNAGSQNLVSKDLETVLKLCGAYRDKTKNAFNCEIGTLISLWKSAEKTALMPAPELLDAEVQRLSNSKGVFIPGSTLSNQAISNQTRGQNLNVDGFAKGWIIDKATEVAISKANALGVSNRFGIMINIGGDIRTYGKLSASQNRIGILAPGGNDSSQSQEVMIINNSAIATSGNGKRDLKVGNRTFSHIISPLSGRPQIKTNQVTVIAPTAAEADAFATAFSVMGVSQSLLFANTHDGVETMIISSGNARFISKGWKNFAAPVVKKTASEAGIDNPLPKGFGLNVNYQIPRFDISDYEYPYIVVWVTDSNKKLVHVLTMVGNQPRWVEENYVFWRRYGRKNLPLVESMSSPSRAPGTYNLEWDGYSSDGTPVAQGQYILHIEASREHGGHQYIKKEISLNQDLFEDIVEAGKELGYINIHYGKKL